MKRESGCFATSCVHVWEIEITKRNEQTFSWFEFIIPINHFSYVFRWTIDDLVSRCLSKLHFIYERLNSCKIYIENTFVDWWYLMTWQNKKKLFAFEMFLRIWIGLFIQQQYSTSVWFFHSSRSKSSNSSNDLHQ